MRTATEPELGLDPSCSRDAVGPVRPLAHLIPICSLVGVVCASFAMAWLWAAMVPLFQSPDEPAHFQYAHALGTAKHFLLARDGQRGFDPEVGSLMDALNTNAIAFHPEVAAPINYGTPAFFAATDKSVAPLPSNYFDRPGHPVPALLSTYPFGAYAVIGAFIGLLQSAFHAGIVEQVFGARDLCCGLFAFGLIFWYFAFRALPLSVPTALGLTALTGLFPLSSFVASYIQPDNVVFALVAPILYLSLRIRNRDVRLSTVAIYGSASGLLLVTKFHYSLCLSLVTLPLVGLALHESRLSPAQIWRRVAWVILPSVVAFSLHLYVSMGAPQGYFAGRTALNVGVAHAFSEGVRPGLGYLLSAAGEGYRNYFLGGTTMVTYWAGFGWEDTSVIFHDAAGTATVWLLITVGTNLTIMFTAILIVRNGFRLLRVAVGRSRREALRLLLRNPLFNIYIVFALFMLTLFVVSGNIFAAQGRNWYPVEGSAFATLLIYAPRALGMGKPYRIWRVSAALFMVAYCTAGSYYCLSAVESRYYHAMDVQSVFAIPHLPVSTEQTEYSLDGISSGSTSLSKSNATALHRFAVVDFRGWALDRRRAVNGGVYITLDNSFVTWATEEDRPDVGIAFGDPKFSQGGFAAHVKLPSLPGKRTLRVMIVNAEHTFVYPVRAVYRVSIR